MAQENQDSKKRAAVGKMTGFIGVLCNLLLAGSKLVIGKLAASTSITADGLNNLSDAASSIVTLLGFKLAEKPADKEHPYGHERMECVAAVVLAVILFATGLGIGWSGIQKIFFMNSDSLEVPGMLALIAALVSIVTKEWMYWFTKFTADKIRSDALRADAWHHRSDALSSIGALIGIGGARLGFPVLDPIASVVICLFILKAAIDVFRDAVDKMVDKSCDEKTMEEMRQVICKQDGVLGISSLQTRMFGSRIYVDAEIEADGSLTLVQAHDIAEEVHQSIEDSFQDVKHCMVHVNPVHNA